VQTLSGLDALRSALAAFKSGTTPLSRRLALVPTMGALHAGHLTLVREAKRRAARVVVSIFVNPRQFAPHEDLATYPRRLEADAALLEAEGVDLLWAPTPEIMYPAGYATTVQVTGLDAVLCGTARPGHFDGVATVVSQAVQPGPARCGAVRREGLATARDHPPHGPRSGPDAPPRRPPSSAYRPCARQTASP